MTMDIETYGDSFGDGVNPAGMTRLKRAYLSKYGKLDERGYRYLQAAWKRANDGTSSLELEEKKLLRRRVAFW